MTTQTKTKLQIIEETVAYYGEDPSRRATGSISCFYKTHKGQMCAVGRCLIHPPNWNVGLRTLVRNSKKLSLDQLLKAEYRGHELGFWNSLQRLHDHSGAWTDKGLSECGLKQLDILKEAYCS